MQLSNIVSGSGGCFIKGTKILTPLGYTNIENILVGDIVLSFNHNGTIELNKVLNTFIHYDLEVYEYTLWGGSTITATPNHWVLNSENYFSEIASINESLALVNTHGFLVPIISSKKVGTTTVYNFTVENNHTYIANNIRVHNGGGGKGSHTAVISPDTLKSTSYAQVLDLLCEGEIKGLVTGDAKSIYINEVPVQNDDGTFNYTDFEYTFNTGTLDQEPIVGFNQVEVEEGGPGLVKYNIPKTINISNPVVDRVRLTLGIPSLSNYKDNGDVTGDSVQYSISIRKNGGPSVVKINRKIIGKNTSKFQFSHIIVLDRSTDLDYFDITVTRLQEDSTSQKIQNDIYFDSYTLITDTKLRYPHSVLCGVKIASDQFTSIPNRGYLVDLLKVKIPNNYDPITRAYTGIWGGQFKLAKEWTDNPAWCFYDLVTNPRYGLGDYIPESHVDKWELYSIAQYCDELVSNGFGGLEPRFTLNVYIQTRQEAIKVLMDIASAFRGMVYTAGGSITVAQDAYVSSPAMQFNNTNVIEGLFTYSGASKKVIHTVAVVTWNDASAQYKQRIEYIEDREGIDRYGYNPTELVAFGCTSRAQAHRIGKWLLYTERYESSIVAFKAGLDSSYCMPGTVIKVFDQARANAGTMLAGRILSKPNNTTLVLDRPITFSANRVYSIRLVAAIEISNIFNNTEPVLNTFNYIISTTGTTDTITTIENIDGAILANTTFTISYVEAINNSIYSISNSVPNSTTLVLTSNSTFTSGKYYTISITNDIGTIFDYVINNPGLYADISTNTISLIGTVDSSIISSNLCTIKYNGLDEELYRVLSIKESDSVGTYDIAAMAYNPAKYDYIENNIALIPQVYTALATKPADISSLSYEEGLYVVNKDKTISAYLHISYNIPDRASYFKIEIQQQNDNWTTLSTTCTDNTYTIYGLSDNTIYSIRVTPYNSALVAGNSAYIHDILVLGKQAPPSNVPWLQVNGGVATWGSVADIDLAGYLLKTGLKTTSGTTEEKWLYAIKESDSLIQGNSYTISNFTNDVIVMIKAVDTSGNESEEATILNTVVSQSFSANKAVNIYESIDGFVGTKVNFDDGGTIPADITWESYNTFPISIGLHGLNTLKDGRVLVTGGTSDDQTTKLKGCYLGNLKDTGIIDWTVTNDLPVNLESHSSIVLSSGVVVLIGGYTDTGVLEPTFISGVVSVDTVLWRYCTSTLNSSSIGTDTACIALDNNKFLITGGTLGGASRNQIYFCTYNADNSISYIASASVLPTVASFHSLVRMSDGRLLLSGGWTGAAELDTQYIGTVNESTNTISWAALTNLPTPGLGDKIVEVYPSIFVRYSGNGIVETGVLSSTTLAFTSMIGPPPPNQTDTVNRGLGMCTTKNKIVILGGYNINTNTSNKCFILSLKRKISSQPITNSKFYNYMYSDPGIPTYMYGSINMYTSSTFFNSAYTKSMYSDNTYSLATYTTEPIYLSSYTSSNSLYTKIHLNYDITSSGILIEYAEVGKTPVYSDADTSLVYSTNANFVWSQEFPIFKPYYNGLPLLGSSSAYIFRITALPSKIATVLSSLEIIIDMPDKSITITNVLIDSSTGNGIVVINDAVNIFKNISSITASIQEHPTHQGTSILVSSKEIGYPSVICIDKNGEKSTAIVDFIIKGY